jgi:hypothetical protein
LKSAAAPAERKSPFYGVLSFFACYEYLDFCFFGFALADGFSVKKSGFLSSSFFYINQQESFFERMEGRMIDEKLKSVKCEKCGLFWRLRDIHVVYDYEKLINLCSGCFKNCWHDAIIVERGVSYED